VAALLAGPRPPCRTWWGTSSAAAARSVAAGVAVAHGRQRRRRQRSAGSCSQRSWPGCRGQRWRRRRPGGGTGPAAAAAAAHAAAIPSLRRLGAGAGARAGFARGAAVWRLGMGATARATAGAEALLAGGSTDGSSQEDRGARSGGDPAGLVEGLKAAAGSCRRGSEAAADVLASGPVRGIKAGEYSSWQAADGGAEGSACCCCCSCEGPGSSCPHSFAGGAELGGCWPAASPEVAAAAQSTCRKNGQSASWHWKAGNGQAEVFVCCLG